MKNLKIVLLFVCLVFPFLCSAKKTRISWTLTTRHVDDRTLDASVSIEAFFDDELKELTLAFYDEGYSVLVEVKDNGGNVVYTNHLMMVDGDNVRIPLEGTSVGKYPLVISDDKNEWIGDFINE
mgnify:CR=1 FL=1